MPYGQVKAATTVPPPSRRATKCRGCHASGQGIVRFRPSRRWRRVRPKSRPSMLTFYASAPLAILPCALQFLRAMPSFAGRGTSSAAKVWHRRPVRPASDRTRT